MRSPVTIYISQVLHQKQEIFFLRNREQMQFLMLFAFLLSNTCTDNELNFPGLAENFSSPKRNRTQWLCKRLGGIQGALWSWRRW